MLIRQFKNHGNKQPFKALSEHLITLRDRAKKGLITSIQYIKELCQVARETVKSQREELSTMEQKDAKSTLTELFPETKTDQTPAVVARIVDDIDEIVKVVCFDRHIKEYYYKPPFLTIGYPFSSTSLHSNTYISKEQGWP